MPLPKMLTATIDKVRVHPASPVTTVAVLRRSQGLNVVLRLSGGLHRLCKTPASVQDYRDS